MPQCLLCSCHLLEDVKPYYECIICRQNAALVADDCGRKIFCFDCVHLPGNKVIQFCEGHVLQRIGERGTDKNLSSHGGVSVEYNDNESSDAELTEDSSVEQTAGSENGVSELVEDVFEEGLEMDNEPSIIDCIEQLWSNHCSSDNGWVLEFLRAVACHQTSKIFYFFFQSDLKPDPKSSHEDHFGSEKGLLIGMLAKMYPNLRNAASALANCLFVLSYQKCANPHNDAQLPGWLPLLHKIKFADDLMAWAQLVHYRKSNTQQIPLSKVSPSSSQRSSLYWSRTGNLPVATVCAADLWRTNLLPCHNDCSDPRDNSVQPDLQKEDHVFLFVSHAWLSEEHPDPEGQDWKTLATFLESIVECTVLLHWGLRSLDIVNETIIEYANDSNYGYNLAEGIGTVRCQLANDVLKIACKHVTTYDKLFDAISSHIMLWIDFACLPQKVDGSHRSPEQDSWFRASLRQLAEIQQSMHTIVIDRPETDNRAWCFAEYVNADVKSIAYTGPVPPELDPRKCIAGPSKITECMQHMIGTKAITSGDVIHSLDLAITNEADADTVCRVLWSTVTKRLVCESGWWDISNRRPWLLTSGKISTVIQYIHELIKLSEGSVMEYDSGWLVWRSALAGGAMAIHSVPTCGSLKLCCLFSLFGIVANDSLFEYLRGVETLLSAIACEVSQVEIQFTDSVQESSEDPSVRFVAYKTSECVALADYIVLVS